MNILSCSQLVLICFSESLVGNGNNKPCEWNSIDYSRKKSEKRETADISWCFTIKCFKDDFQSVLRTLESLFTTFVLFHVRRHKM